MKNKVEYLKQFALRGLVGMGFGPIVLGVVYTILGICGVTESVGIYEMPLGIFTITLLAFLCGGITVVYQIEELAISKAITLHGIILYIAYATVYIVNGWLKDGLVSFLVFTGIFIVGYLLVWLIIYFITRNNAEKLNNRLKNRAE